MEKKMKILFVTHGADMMGANRSMLNLIAGLQAYEVECVILTPDDGKLAASVASDQKIIISSYYRWAHTEYLSKEYWLNYFLQKKNKKRLNIIAEEIKDDNFDLIYSNSSTIGIGAQLADRLNIPHVWRIREFGEEDYNLSFWKGRTHFIQWANKAAAISFISKAIQDKFNQQITAPKYCIYNGVISKVALNKIIPSNNTGAFTFLIIGLIHPNKGQFDAIIAFHAIYKEFPNSKLIIVGKGRRLYTRKMKKYISDHGLSNNINFLGYVDHPHEVYKKVDCLLMCSKSEGMGRVTVEAMIHGKPVIGYNGGATPELVKHEKNGLIYSNQKDLSACMTILLKDRALAEQYGKEGREMAEEFVTEISVAKEYRIFKDLITPVTQKNN